jgi:enamine deaminase RidA (YjgF/YER057c/UK114 family)
MRMLTLALVLATVLASPGAAREPADVVMPTDAAALAQQQQFGYADAVVAGDMIYLSGVIAAPRAGEKGLQPAYERAFAQIAATLQRAGASWDDVVDLTTFHTDLAAQVGDIAAVKARHVKAPFPAWTAIGIDKLFEPTGVTEIKVVAQRPKR